MKPLRKDALLYLSGPMTGYPGYNYAEFNLAAQHLRDRGWEVINPAETAGGTVHLDREKFIRMDIGYVMAADALVMLPGWPDSKGACLEAALAHNLGLPIYEFDPLVLHGIGSEIGITRFQPLFDYSFDIPHIEEVN